MCLQWCHVRRWLINNDFVCTGCDYGDPQRLPAQFSCRTCAHRVVQVSTEDMCGLTHEYLPVVRRCCHWNVAPCSAITLVLKNDDLAPWIQGPQGVVGVFNESDTAPDVVVDGEQRVAVTLDELSVPLVYGVPSPNWDDALGLEPLQPIPGLQPAPTPDVDALVEALGCIEEGGPVLVAALDALIATLHPNALVCTEVTWRNYVTSLVELCREHYGTDPDITNVLQHIEEAVCI